MQFFENRQKKHKPGRELPSATFPKLKSRSAQNYRRTSVQSFFLQKFRQKFNFVRIAKKSTSQIPTNLAQLFLKLQVRGPKTLGGVGF